MLSISALTLSRASRAALTQSNWWASGSLIFNDLPRGPDLQEWVSPLQIDGVVGMDTRQVDDVLEVPADQDINSRDRCKGDVESIGAHAWSDCPIGDVGGREILDLSGHGKHFNQVGANSSEGVTNRCGGRLEFAKRELGDHKRQVAALERLQEPAGRAPKLAVLGSSDH